MNRHFNAAFIFLVASALSVTLAIGCGGERLIRNTYQPSETEKISPQSPFLKVHMMNGNVYVFNTWNLNHEKRQVEGTAKLFDAYRELVKSDSFSIPFDSVALFETNVISRSDPTEAMSLMTGVSVAMTVFCVINPKACFGSCPTFYAWDGKRMKVQAEAFSSSVTPAFESNDVDALYDAKPMNRDFELVLTNEAMETHVIRYAHLLVAHRSPGHRVFVTPSGEFYETGNIISPAKATAEEGDCLARLESPDGVERFSSADSTNLATKDTVELSFDYRGSARTGLILGYRQTLMTTYLFYQALSYMGNSVGYWIAGLQRQSSSTVHAARNLFWGSLGGIDIMVQSGNGEWVKSGECSEIGPIATNFEIVPLPQSAEHLVRIRLVMTKGMWRIDYAALGEIDSEVTVTPIQTCEVVRGDSTVDDSARARLTGSGGPLVTMPGDRYSVLFRLPDDFRECELFLEAKGYYLEWIRSEWIKEENPKMVLTMMTAPSDYLRLMAPQFKKVEPQMEETFWRSKYVAH